MTAKDTEEFADGFLGVSKAGAADRPGHYSRIVTLVYTLRGNNRRLISAQERRQERNEYEKAYREKKPEPLSLHRAAPDLYSGRDRPLQRKGQHPHPPGHRHCALF